MSHVDNVVITDVTKKNFEKLWPQILEDVAGASFIAIDAEMSGLGSPKKTMTSDLNERYAVISSLAATRSIISLGLACFQSCRNIERKDCGENELEIGYSVSVYNVMLLCSDPYTVDPKAVEFLVEHGFNFNKQFAEGISFYRGNDKPDLKTPEVSMRNLFCEIIRRRKPLVLHNGFADLIFMYQSFYAQCPSKLAAFMADLSEIFPSGIYDTKYIAEFLDHTPASFLLYLFKFNLLKNEELGHQGKISLKVSFTRITDQSMFVSLHENSTSDMLKSVCLKYAAYGWCLHGKHCKESHNIDAILQFHKMKKRKKRGRKTKSPKELTVKVSRLSPDEQNGSVASLISGDAAFASESHTSQMTTVASGSPIAVASNVLVETDKHTFSRHIDNNKCEEKPSDDNTHNTTSSSMVNSNCDTLITAYKNGGDGNESHCIVNGQNATPNDGHRSGIDAFMTGYIFAVFIVSRCKSIDTSNVSNQTSKDFSDDITYLPSVIQKNVVNKLYLSGKQIPLPVCKSEFTKTSKNHSEKIIKVYLT